LFRVRVDLEATPKYNTGGVIIPYRFGRGSGPADLAENHDRYLAGGADKKPAE
jgi:hypothetical protein